ncbi:DUF6134 family protein [Hanstruepera marina]|uniref:DUF6134 family protein n=1 Tax=Hanstruepera marina TaxID=2873265 RepID=UPI001CA761E3|nr:DUF6134 family protein [Hanstruepera marina]
MKRWLFSIVFVSYQLVSAQTQTKQFNILHDGKSLGTLKATKTTDGDITTYASHTKIQYHLIVPIEIIYDYQVSFNNKELREAKANIMVKGNEKTNTKTLITNKGYNFYSDGQLQKNIPETSINHSIVQLLFEEPIGLTRIYSEEHGTFHTLKKIKDSTYLKTTNSGHKSTYHYQNGVLQRTETDAGIIKFSIVSPTN